MDFATIVLCYSEKNKDWANLLRVELERVGGKFLEVLMNAASPGRNFAPVLDSVSAWAGAAVLLISRSLLEPDSMAIIQDSRLHPDLRKDLRVFAVVVDDTPWLELQAFRNFDVIEDHIKGTADRICQTLLRDGSDDFTPKALSPPRDLKVLLIMDSRWLSNVARVLVNRFGLAVETAGDSEDALIKAQMNDVGVIVTDIFLAGEDSFFGGIESARKLKELYPNRDILFATLFKRDRRISNQLERNGLQSNRWFSLSDPSFDLARFGNHIVFGLNRYQQWLSTFTAGVEIDHIDLELYKAIEQHPELLRTLEWRKFEELLADLLGKLKYEVELMEGTKDGGIDIIAFRRAGVLGPQKYLIQAKRWKNKVGVEPVQRLLFQHSHHRATKACLATTSTFTRGAWGLAKEYQWQLELRDYNGLREWVKQALVEIGHKSKMQK
jgi:CheY-like chemotaxis protein